MPEPTILVFTRAAQAGRVKTRLAPPLSPAQAAAVHEAALRDVVASARGAASDVRLVFDPSPGAEAWFAAELDDLPRTPQAGADLGERLAAAFAAAFDGDCGAPDRVLLVGSDSPTLPSDRLAEGLAALHEADVVLGPARDGGYYLVGMRRQAWPRAAALFRDVPWSTDAVLAVTRRRAEAAGLSLRELAPWYDIDTADDLRNAARDTRDGSHLAALLRSRALPVELPVEGGDPVRRDGDSSARDGDRPPRSEDDVPRSGRRRWWVLAAGLAIVAVLVFAGPRLAGVVAPALEWIRGLGRWAPAAFVAAYAVATLSGIPASLLTVAAGAVFGLARGTLVVWIGATLGAGLAFIVARRLGRGAIERRIRGHRRLAAFDEALAREGGRIVFLLRLSPVVPFTALNFALGLTRVRLRGYLLGTAFGMLPGTFMYVYAGHVAGTAAAAGAGAAQAAGGARIALTVVGFAATVAVVVLLTRSARRALARAAGERPKEGDPR